MDNTAPNGLWSWIVANGPGVSASVTCVTCLVAVITLVRASRDSRVRSRPTLFAEFRQEPDSESAYSLIIRNAGPSVARDVRVTFDPPVEQAPGSSPEKDRIIKRFSRSIPAMAPGQELRSLWATYGIQGEKKGNLIPTPDDVTVTITYHGSTRHEYQDSFPLMAETITLDTFVTSSASVKGRLKTLAEESKKQAKSLESIAQTLRSASIREAESGEGFS